MNKKLFSVLFIIVILASFSAIGCKNNNTTPSGTDIGQKYQGDWMLNATVKYEVPEDIPAQLESFISTIKSVIPEGKVFNNIKTTINSDGSITSVNPLDNKEFTIDKSKITKESDYIYVITTTTPEMSGTAESMDKYTFNADGTEATTSSCLKISINNNIYEIYLYRDGKLTKQ